MTVLHSGKHQQDRRPVGDSQPEGSDVIFPVRFDGEPGADPAFALPLPADFQPWEIVVAAYVATYVADRTDNLRRAA